MEECYRVFMAPVFGSDRDMYKMFACRGFAGKIVEIVYNPDNSCLISFKTVESAQEFISAFDGALVNRIPIMARRVHETRHIVYKDDSKSPIRGRITFNSPKRTDLERIPVRTDMDRRPRVPGLDEDLLFRSCHGTIPTDYTKMPPPRRDDEGATTHVLKVLGYPDEKRNPRSVFMDLRDTGYIKEIEVDKEVVLVQYDQKKEALEAMRLINTTKPNLRATLAPNMPLNLPPITIPVSFDFSGQYERKPPLE